MITFWVLFTNCWWWPILGDKCSLFWGKWSLFGLSDAWVGFLGYLYKITERIFAWVRPIPPSTPLWQCQNFESSYNGNLSLIWIILDSAPFSIKGLKTPPTPHPFGLFPKSHLFWGWQSSPIGSDRFLSNGAWGCHICGMRGTFKEGGEGNCSLYRSVKKDEVLFHAALLLFLLRRRMWQWHCSMFIICPGRDAFHDRVMRGGGESEKGMGIGWGGF